MLSKVISSFKRSRPSIRRADTIRLGSVEHDFSDDASRDKRDQTTDSFAVYGDSQLLRV